jgi:hypothetical protein
VTCTSASDCWAVGYYSFGGPSQTLIEQWNGASWAIVSSPNTSDGDDLDSVTCASASDCWAVGTSVPTYIGSTLIEQWNGTSWAVVSSPNLGGFNVLSGVTCASASECWAVGNYGILPLIEKNWLSPRSVR